MKGNRRTRRRVFFEFLHGQRAPRLEQLRFSVLALGDHVVQAVLRVRQRLDRRLEELGAHRLHERIDCDVDYHD